ncbi:bifunctional hydroxymethylpyrimidine kinase/phosphomethylpyrimidine kinase [Campylobacter hepaticus]|uniref:hydroxymethylpyrimidine kinase n=1 Tax=Campylobacter hepaticus TaxID=1813019 RepID=A0A424Z211_9BACT|nr:bifunctional hydroxymethylpyrimidine kinase/phosphomethylpyrimidine kinase [Campylobacter hepaticus]AXP08431.1 bifunctional hydroxymethylpyrimidine kinase/phosphomethylpyrimidine kinase [Campylobacter hepaticus]MCZ0772262.1 bifunctional hydroxymethylpyrimidine kinase/phosphomethylpyrimidine kinase [Campylobacter hepaticus]MCZ0773730.1 bifunctional hydroxymethylpyrimidine kinase/phosphomethylpyrimidine kinase [Campylobacter hepaticus]MCZ0774981.1 bifunctional hydroxymethylpyrimidine kinase/ph
MKAKGSDLIPVLTIAGSDCSGGAGIQADLKTFSAHKLFGMSVVLSVVAENTTRVIGLHHIPSKNVDEQMLAVFEDIIPKATKIGMIGTCELMSCVAKNLEKFKPKNVVIDPVMFAKNGYALMPEKNCDFFKKTIIEFADILTPNIPEAEFLCGFKIFNEEEMIQAAKHLCSLGAKAVLLKGGHSEYNANDVLFDGENIHIFKSERINTKNTHGTGCTLSSAIASNLAQGKNLFHAVREAKEYVKNAIYYSVNLGKGHGPINHFLGFSNER